MTTRRDVLKGGICLAAILAVGESPAIIKKSLIAARYALTGGGNGPTAKDYVQDGLIAMWDGIENAGWGVHDAAATTWKDLIGGRDFYDLASGVSFGDYYIHLPALGDLGMTGYKYTSIGLGDAATVECVIRRARKGAVCVTQFNGYALWIGFRANGTFNFSSGGLCAPANASGDTFATFSGTRPAGTSGGTWTCYKNAVDLHASSSGMTFGSFAMSLNSPLEGNISESDIASIRLYSRALTAAEIAHNYAKDKERFNMP